MTLWKSPVDGSWTDPTAWDTGMVPGAADPVAITVAGTYRVTLMSGVSSAALMIGDSAATVAIINGASLTLSGDLTNAGYLGLDSDFYTSEGGSSVTVGGTLTNTGQVVVGKPNGGTSGLTSLTVGQLAGAGTVEIYGGASPNQATLNVLSAAPTTLTATTGLSGDSLLEYASGSIDTIAANVSLALDGSLARVATAADTTTDSALTGLAENDGTLRVLDGNSVQIGGDLNNPGFLGLDSDPYSDEGGSSVSIAGTLANAGTLQVGNSTRGTSAASTLTLGNLTGTGGVTLYGGDTNQATVNVLSAAPDTLVANTSLRADTLLEYASGSIAAIGSGISLILNGANARLANAADITTNSALTGLATIAGTLQMLNGNTASITGDVAESGFLGLDNDGYSTEGGSSLTITGTLSNTGALSIGPFTGGLGADTTLTVGQLTGTANVSVYGSATKQATLDDLSPAPAILAANTYLSGDALVEYASGSIATIASGISLTLVGTTARVADAADTTTNSALTGLSTVAGSFRLLNGNTASITGDLANPGFIGLDNDGYSSEGGSSLTVTGTLSNTGGGLVLGPFTGGLGADTTLTVGQLTGTANVSVYGSVTKQATLDILSAAPATLAANTYLSGDALLEYASGLIVTIASGIELTLVGATARVADATDTTTNSALTGLATVAGSLRLLNGNTASITGDLANPGFIGLDSDYYTSEGGSNLTVTGTLNNTGSLVVGPFTGGLSADTTLTVGQLTGTGSVSLYGSATKQATLDILSAAPGTLAANTYVSGDALLEYTSGSIATIVNGVTLTLFGATARVADTADTTTNSALTGLSTVAGSLRLLNGNAVHISGDLANSGFIGLDDEAYSTYGGSSLTVTGTLSNTGAGLVLGPYAGGLSADTTLTVGQLTGTANVSLYGSATKQATLDILSAAPGTLAANTFLRGDALLEYASGSIATIANGVTLTLVGATARVADAADTTSDSALTGLSTVAGTIVLLNGSTARIAGNLTNSGLIGLDDEGYSTDGGSSLTVTGTLNNTGSLVLGPFAGGLSADTTLTVGQLTGAGSIGVYGSATKQATLIDLSAAPGTLTGNVTLAGDALLRYASGQITRIATGVTLSLTGAAAHVADVSATGSNSALTGLAENDGTLVLHNGESLATTAGLLNAGAINLDGDGYSTEGGSSLTIAGTLTNTGSVTLGPFTGGLSANTVLTVDQLLNQGTVNLYGNGASATGTLLVRGAAENDATLTIGAGAVLRTAAGQVFTQAGGHTTIAGTLDTGMADIAGGTLELDAGGSVTGGLAFTSTTGTLALGAGAVAPAVTGFVMGDTLELLGATVTQINPAYSAATGLTTLSITLSDMTVRTVRLVGDATGASFNVTNTGGNALIGTSTQPGTPADPVIQETSGTGTLTPSTVANTYLLNLGTTTLGGPDLSASLAVLNAAMAPSDTLSGNFTVTGTSLFQNSGFGPFSNLGAGAADTAPRIVLPSDRLGTFTETLTLSPVDQHTDGTTTPLSTETVVVTGSIGASPPPVPPPQPTAVAWGDVHLGTFDGLAYTFQAAGEFVLARSTVAGDTFQVQARMVPYSASASVSVMTAVAAAIGADRVTFESGRAGFVQVDGADPGLTTANPTVQLGGGTLHLAANGVYVLSWSSGESLTIDDRGDHLDLSLSLSASDGAGSVAGLFGSNSGPANDFALADGTVLPQPITTAQLYGQYANAWRVTDASSLLDYAAGQTTATFTDSNFPFDALQLANLPGAVITAATAQTDAAGLTNATIAQDTQLDYAATGNASFLADGQFAQAVGTTPVQAAVAAPAPVPALGVNAPIANITEAQGGPTSATFTIYLTAAAAHDTVVNYAVTAPGAAFLGATAFGGTLPSGTAIIAAGQTSTNVTISLPAAAFGTEPNDGLQLTITPADATPLFAPTAQILLINPNPEPGLPAEAAIALVGGNGTLTQTGTSYTLDLGTLQQGSGPDTVQIGIENTGVAGSDQLVGRFVTTGDSAYTLVNFSTFGPVAGQSTATAPHITLSTDNTGTFTETITLSPQDSNGTGYVQDLPAQTLTVTGRVANLPSPVIAAPTALTGFVNMPTQLTPLSVSDPNAPGQPLTVVVSVASGVLNSQQTGAFGLSGNGTNSLTITGNLDAVNAALLALTYTATAVGTDTLTLTATDADRASATQTVALTTDLLPKTGALLMAPQDTVFLNQPSGLAGYKLIDPYDQAMGTVLTLSFDSPNSILDIKGPAGAGTVTGQGTGSLTITGTVDQINAQLADDLIADLGGLELSIESLQLFLAGQAKHQLAYYALTANLTGTGSFDGDIGPTNEGLVTVAGPEAKGFLIGVTAAAFALNSVTAYAVGANPPSAAALQRDLWVIMADAHIVTEQGTIYDFNAAGEFILAASTQSGDTFEVQARLQPLPGSQSASVVTQVAAQIGTDRVTFAANRASVVFVNGAAQTLSLNNPIRLSGGTLTQVSADTYKLVWNTGETLSVTADGDYLNAQIAAGPNNKQSSFFGLDNISTEAGQDFTLPDGTVLPQPLSQSDLLLLADTYRVPQSFSLLDYAPGETTATFTDTSFPQIVLNLAALPADVLARAAAVAAAAGITDAGVLQAAEFDYIASGGDLRFVNTDASLLAGVATAPATVTPPPSAVAIGAIAEATTTQLSGSGSTSIRFEAFLTAAAAVLTTIDYAVVAPGAGYLGAASFGGTLPSGSISIAAGQTTGEITITVPQGAMGSDPTDQLEIALSSPAGVPLLSGTAKTTLTQAIAGPPPAPVFVDLLNLGTFTHVGANYTLDLGDVQYGEPLPDLRFGIINAASAPADALGGTVTATTVDGFTTSGIGLPTLLAAGQSYYGIDVQVDYTKFGQNSETITFAPVDSNGTGFSAALPTQTLTITDNIVAPTMVFSKAWGDVHIVTYNQLTYDFQAVGEFTLAKSRIPGDSFDIQLRLVPYYNIINGNVSIIQAVGVAVGADRVTFDVTRSQAVYIDGAPSTLSETAPIVNLAGGSVTELSDSVWKVVLATGEEVTVSDFGNHFDVSDGIPLSAPDTVGGLQGEDAGQANDFQLSDGTVLAQPLTYQQLYGPYADSWRITDASSLMDYLPGQSTATFTDHNYPADYFDVTKLPASVQAQAEAAVAAAGITDPGLAAAAEEDYLATGDASFISGAAAVQADVPSTTVFTPAAIPAPPPQLAVQADPPGVVEASTGLTQVVFDIDLTEALASDLDVAYTVVDGGAGYLGAATFAQLPAGVVTIAAGATLATVTIAVPQNALGTAPSAKLELAITPVEPVAVAIPNATATIANYQPEPGTPPVVRLADLTTPANLSAASSVAYTLNLGIFSQGAMAQLEQLQLINDAIQGSDSLTGAFGVPIGSGFTIVGTALTKTLGGGESYNGLTVTPRTDVAGVNTETITFSPRDVNASGYMGLLPTVTLTITDTVLPAAAAALNTPDTLVFPNVHVGTTENQGVSVSNTAGTASLALSVTPTADGAAYVTGTVTGLAPGSTDATSIRAGLDTSAAGQLKGMVTLSSSSVPATAGSDASATSAAPLATSPQVALFGFAYRLAAPTVSVAPVSTIIHVGDPGTVQLSVANTAAADVYSENLLATLTGSTGAVSVVTPTTGEIAAGTASTALAVHVATASAGTVSGTATVGLVSDGGTGAGSIDGLGQTTLAPQSVAVSVQVDNYAVAGLASSGPALTAGSTANSFVLDLGTIQQGSSVAPVVLSVLNTATGPADLLDGTFTSDGSAAFTTVDGPFVGLAAGSSTNAVTIAVDTSSAGTFSETIVLHPTDENAAGYRAAQADQTVTVKATIAPQGTQGSPASNDAYSITGVQIAQPASDASAIAPLAAVTIANSDAAAIGTATLTLSSAANGTLSNLGNGTLEGAIYSVTGSTAAIQAALRGLVFTPTAHEVTPGQAVSTNFAMTVSDGVSTATANASIIATGVNDAPTITGTHSTSITDEQTAAPFSGVTILDVDNQSGVTETVTITETGTGANDANGSLSGNGLAETASGSGVYTLTGSLAQAISELDALTFKPKVHEVAPGNAVTTGFLLSVAQSANGTSSTVSDSASAVAVTAVNDAPTITGTHATSITDQQTATPFSGVTILDVDNQSGVTDTVTITGTGTGATDANGSLSGTGLSETASGSGVYTLTGSLAQVTSELDALTFNPKIHEVAAGQTVTTDFTLSVTQSANGTASTASDAPLGQTVITVLNTQPAASSQPGTQPGGATATATAPGLSTLTTPVYRFFDTVDGTHLFTQSLSEAQSILATRPDLVSETNNFGAVDPQTDSAAEAVYRFFETSNGTHFFTASRPEFLGLTTPGSATYRPDFIYEASSTFYEDSTQQAGDVAVYRLFDSVHGTVFLTGSQSEYAGLTTAGSSTYRPDLNPEGIAFYAPTGNFST